MGQNIYVILGVSRDADLPRIQRAYRRLVEHYLPEVAAVEVEPGRNALAPSWRAPVAPSPPLYDVADELFGGYVPGIYTRGRTASRRKDLYVELILEPEEAARGGLFPLQVPVEPTCAECGNSGYRGNIVCPTCLGAEPEHHEVRISVPPGVRHGERAQLCLGDIGLPEVGLNVLVSIAG